ncbi:MAG TPA: hypothetical protein VK762_17635, partial [Polyangiaceae bacterium]|nr:hypothetical protein [Polyangiaceae bacterium]
MVEGKGSARRERRAGWRGPRLFAAVFWATALAAPPAIAEPSCPVSQIGQPCAGGTTTCVEATCTANPGPGATSTTCGVCTYVPGVYCLPADVGKACSDGGVCSAGGSSSGSGGNGSVTSYGLQTCEAPVDAGASSSGGLGPSC